MELIEPDNGQLAKSTVDVLFANFPGQEEHRSITGVPAFPYASDLHGFIEFLDAEHPNQIVRITKEVDPKFEVSGILERLEKDGRLMTFCLAASEMTN